MGVNKYAVIDEMGYILKSSDDIEEIKKFKQERDNRRTGKSTRALFQALSVPCGSKVYFICMNGEHAKIMFKECSKFLDKLGFHYQATPITQIICTGYSASIMFTTKETYDQMMKSSTDFVIYDLE